jgi:glycosyltransferase involved in cell wall biosynthesis
MNRFSLLIPNFNHKETIASLLDRLMVHRLPCLIVNDGSDAQTCRILEQQQSMRDWVKVLHLPKQRGKGGAVLAGLFHLHESGFTHAVQLDADGQHDPDDVPKFLQQAEAHPAALILGRPVYNPDAPKSRIIGRQISRFWVWVETLSLDIADPMLGYRVYPIGATVAVARQHRLGTRMDFDPEIAVRLHWTGTPVRNIQTRIEYPNGGRSHFLMVKDNTLISWLHTRLFFGMLIRLPKLLAKGGR